MPRLLFRCKIAAMIVGAAMIANFPINAWSQQPQWKNNGGIVLSISTPENNTYVSINAGSIALVATASDNDCFRYYDGPWYPYSDDVSSGDDPNNYHIWWTLSGDGELTDMYGGSGAYTPPGYSAGNDLRSATIIAHADDFNRGSDTNGYDDGPAQQSRTIKIWQVSLTKQQSGTEDASYNGSSAPAYKGGIDLGYKQHGDIVNVDGGGTGKVEFFCLNTQIQGAMSEDSNVPTGNFEWRQEIMGEVKVIEQGGSWAVYQQHSTWTDDSPISGYADGNSQDTDQYGNPDVNKIFMRDSPGAGTGIFNDEWDPYIGINIDFSFRNWVVFGGVIVSDNPGELNNLTWSMQKEISRPSLTPPNNKWANTIYQDR